MLGIFLDQETTGLDSYRHGLLEVAFKIISLRTGEVKASFQSVVRQSEEAWERRDLESIAVNGFSWEEVVQGASAGEIRKQIISIFESIPIRKGKAVFICQNPSFDRAFFSHLIDVYSQEKLNWPYHWLDFASMYWALQVKQARETEKELPDQISLSKDTIAQNFLLPKEDKPHRAMQGVDHLLLCYQNVVGFPERKMERI
jgi:oligoribonuclease